MFSAICAPLKRLQSATAQEPQVDVAPSSHGGDTSGFPNAMRRRFLILPAGSNALTFGIGRH
ncbi:hypothetical protein [Rubrimonas cliftonensis]|uniref:hypothetical protein n=1 Tax=Rubrimonas cliftonensis TaxID=89524 RepID=UPI00111500E4|nr:hypothetical protein [Rubrimonas cliftonensis]